MLAAIFKNKMDFHIWKENYHNEWIQVFYPVMLGIYFVLGFIIATFPGFIVGGISNLFLGEEPSFIIGSIVAILFLVYLVAKTKVHNKTVIGTFFASLRSPLYPKTSLHKKCLIQRR